MGYYLYILFGVISFVLITVAILFINRKPCENKIAQKQLNEYVDKNLSPSEIGRFYERYIGHLYENEGCHVKYHGAVNGFDDLGRDLIVKKPGEILIIQTKCWAKHKKINEKHIFQLFGSMEHYKRSAKYNNEKVRAVFYTSAQYSDVAQDAAEVLGVEINNKELDRTYPLIKCNVNNRGQKIYHLPFDPYYDKIRIDSSEDKFYVHTVDEAVARGFRRARTKVDEAA